MRQRSYADPFKWMVAHLFSHSQVLVCKLTSLILCGYRSLHPLAFGLKLVSLWRGPIVWTISMLDWAWSSDYSYEIHLQRCLLATDFMMHHIWAKINYIKSSKCWPSRSYILLTNDSNIDVSDLWEMLDRIQKLWCWQVLEMMIVSSTKITTN